METCHESPPTFTMSQSDLQILRGELPVPGASLRYEVRTRQNDTPLLLLIPGCTGITIFASLAAQMAAAFTVVSYERRGYAGSIQAIPSAPEDLMQVNGDDAAALIRHFSPNVPAIVFGTSGGAMVSLELIRRHTHLVQTLILHEPPVMSVLPAIERLDWEVTLKAITDAYRSGGIGKATEIFGRGFCNLQDAQAMSWAMTAGESLKDTEYFYEHEINQVSIYKLDIGVLSQNKPKLLLVGGRDSKDYKPHRPLEFIGQQLGLEVAELAGGHVGYAAPDTATTFALELQKLIDNHAMG